jgi:hypothetical protein
MTDEQNVAPELMEAFDRLVRYVSPEVVNDEQVRNNIFIYLQLGGERLARQYIQMIQKIFPEKIVLKKIRLSDESDDDTQTATEDASEDDDDDDDDDGDEDEDEDDDEDKAVDVEPDDDFDC